MAPADVVQKVFQRLQRWLPFVLCIASFFTSIVIPALRFAEPGSFIVLSHVDQIAVPEAVGRLWPPPLPMTAGNAVGGTVGSTAPDELLVIKVLNQASTVRHNISLRVEGVTRFSGAALGPLDSSTFEMATWRVPEFREDENVLTFATAARLSGNATVRVFVWGRFAKFLGPSVSSESQEGPASVESEVPLSGWTLLLADNMWWVAMLTCFGIGLWLLRRFEYRRK